MISFQCGCMLLLRIYVKQIFVDIDFRLLFVYINTSQPKCWSDRTQMNISRDRDSRAWLTSKYVWCEFHYRFRWTKVINFHNLSSKYPCIFRPVSLFWDENKCIIFTRTHLRLGVIEIIYSIMIHDAIFQSQPRTAAVSLSSCTRVVFYLINLLQYIYELISIFGEENNVKTLKKYINRRTPKKLRRVTGVRSLI